MRHITILAATLAAAALAGCSSHVPSPPQTVTRAADSAVGAWPSADGVARAIAALGPGVDVTVTRGVVRWRVIRRGVAVLLVTTTRDGVSTLHCITAPAATAPALGSDVAVFNGPNHSAFVKALPSS